ncbi:MAG: hypothetical protein IPJ13_21840 [Saprospiraceae bacterium]|nr:hypothetical protein [Saprospiraceae bacterium]
MKSKLQETYVTETWNKSRARLIKEVNATTRGWLQYFKGSAMKSKMVRKSIAG